MGSPASLGWMLDDFASEHSEADGATSDSEDVGRGGLDERVREDFEDRPQSRGGTRSGRCDPSTEPRADRRRQAADRRSDPQGAARGIEPAPGQLTWAVERLSAEHQVPITQRRRSRGFILLDRNIVEWWGWSDPFRVKAWLDLLLIAAYRRHYRDFQGHPVHVERGQLVTSYRILAKRWGCSVKKVRTLIKRLEESGAIRAQPRAHLGTLITVRNYGAYQDPSNRGGTARDPRRTRRGHGTGTQNIKGNTDKTGKERGHGEHILIEPEPDARERWNEVLGSLERETDPHTFNTWLRPTRGVEIRHGELVVDVPNEVFRSWLDDNHRAAAEGEAGQPVRFVCSRA